jgi:hypothetical protein
MKALVRLAVGAVVIAGLAAPANALIVAGVIPEGTATNDFAGLLPDTSAGTPIAGYYGAQLYLIGGPADILVEWYGGEASYANQFYWDGALLYTHVNGVSNPSSTAVDSDLFSNVAGGLLPFSFVVPPTLQSVANGTNPDNFGTEPNFFISFNLGISDPNLAPTGGQYAWIFFDDGGAQNDDNHDDMVIKLSITSGEVAPVPEPGSMILLGSGLAGLWMRRRRG